MSIERSREFDLKNGLVVLAHPRSCYFCDHLTDIFLDTFNGTPYYDTNYIVHDYTQDDGYCSWGERMSND